MCAGTKGFDRVSPFVIPMLIVNMAPGLVSMRFGAKGPNTRWSPRAPAATTPSAMPPGSSSAATPT